MLDELNELKGELQRLDARLERGVSSASTINVNAGGVGVWISTICCVFMLGIAIMGGLIILDQNRKIGELNAYLSAIYMQAPHLKQEERE